MVNLATNQKCQSRATIASQRPLLLSHQDRCTDGAHLFTSLSRCFFTSLFQPIPFPFMYLRTLLRHSKVVTPSLSMHCALFPNTWGVGVHLFSHPSVLNVLLSAREENHCRNGKVDDPGLGAFGRRAEPFFAKDR